MLFQSWKRSRTGKRGLVKMGRGSDSPRYPSEKLILADGVYTLGKRVTFWSFPARLSDVHHRTQSSSWSFGRKMLHFSFDPLMLYLRSFALITASDLLMVKLEKSEPDPSGNGFKRLEELRGGGVTPANSTGLGFGKGGLAPIPFSPFSALVFSAMMGPDSRH